MGVGDYMCVTLRGGAPWGFTLSEGERDSYRPFLVSQVEESGRAFLAGVQEGDEVVSLNGEPCADLTLSQAFELIDTSIDCLQLLVKRYCVPAEDHETEEPHCGQKDSSDAALESTTLHILSPDHGSHSPRDLYISESHDEAYYEVDSDEAVSKGFQLVSTELHVPSSGDQRGQEGDEERCFSPGDMVELKVSMSDQTMGCTSLGSALGIQGEFSNREAIEMVHTPITTTESLSDRKPLRQHGVVVSSPSMVEQPAASKGRSISRVGGPEVSGSVGSQSEGGGEHGEGDPRSFTVSFGIPSDEATPAEDQDSDSEGDQDKPNKHRARHSRLRRCESLSEKQVKEAKSKCKRIALLLTAAPSNPNNKGVLMFKKHRQRAKKYTLVSYGTGEDEPEYSDEDDGENEETDTLEFTLVAPKDCEINKHFQTNTHINKGVLTINWDKGLLEIERNLNNQAEMECLPETKGKGAVMFAQRRQRMDELAAEHEELRRQGIPVEGVQEAEKKLTDHSYIQSTTESHAYMDVNVHQQSQQQQQHQQYHEQRYNEQQQNFQQQYQKQHQQYEQPHFQQQTYQQQPVYNQEHQHYSTSINGAVQHHVREMPSSFSNRTAKPFCRENTATTPYSPAVSGLTQDSVGHGEQIASRDERISTPAIKTGLLLEARKRNSGKPMFTFKERPKVSPNPALLNLLNKSDKKAGFESGPEEDYLSLGAEACNFLQSSLKHKSPPPVAPKPAINPNALAWSPQIEVTNQGLAEQAENSVSTPAVAPTAESTPAAELEPSPAPAADPSTPPAPQEVPITTTTIDQQAWTLPEHESQEQLPSEPAPVTAWPAAQTRTQQQPSTNSWHQVQHQEPVAGQSSPQPPWGTLHPPQAQPQTLKNTWSSQNQPSWTHPQEQTQTQPHWAHSQEQPNLQQPTWGQTQDQLIQQQQTQAPWAQPPQTQTPHQPSWMQQPQQSSQSQPPWVHQGQSEPQQQPHWVQQQQHQAPEQPWFHAQASGQPQPSWVSAQPPQQPSVSTWPPSQAQIQPPWIQSTQAQAPVQPEASVKPWAPVAAQSQPSWTQHPSEHGQQPMSWAQAQNQAQHQAPWVQPGPPQATPQSNWFQSPSTTSPQPPMSTLPSAQTQPRAAVNAWVPHSHQTPMNVSTSMMNTRPSPKPWTPPQNAPQNQTLPPQPQRMHSFTGGQSASSPMNPLATVLTPPSQGSSYEMPAMRGKGADMFAKRLSRMEKFVVDSETVEANRASRATSPAASLPNEWKYTPNVRPPPPHSYNPIQSPSYPLAATKQAPPSSLSSKVKNKGKGKDTRAPKPLNAVDVMKHKPYQLSSSLFIFGPAAETEKSTAPKPESSPPNPPVQNKSDTYEQVVQSDGPFNVQYPQQTYGMPMQPMMHDGHDQQSQPIAYPPPDPYQQLPDAQYQQSYIQQYQQPDDNPQGPQSPSSPYQHPQQGPSQPGNSPYLAPYQPQPPSSYVAPNVAVAAGPESVSGGSTAPKPKFTAKKSSAQAFGRKYSLSPPARVPFKGQKSAPSSPSPRPLTRSSTEKQTTQSYKRLTPWEAASRHPTGQVDEAFSFQDLQQTIVSNIHLAAQRKTLPEPPEEWKAKVSYQASPKTGDWSPNRNHSRAPLPAFVSPTWRPASIPVSHVGYRSLARQWQPQRPQASNLGASYSEYKRPLGQQVYKSVYTSNTTSWRR